MGAGGGIAMQRASPVPGASPSARIYPSVPQEVLGDGGGGGRAEEASTSAGEEGKASCVGGVRKRTLEMTAPRNVARKLLNRETSGAGARYFAHTMGQEKFRGFDLRLTCDTYDMEAHEDKLPFLRKRSKIVEIVAAKDLLFALAHSGVCAAFSRDTNKRICFLNIARDEVIRSLFYNKNNNSIITVSVYAADNFSSLKCRSTSIEFVRRGQPDQGFGLFQTESLRWPGFVEFDDVNGKVLTYSAQDKVYKVFDLKNYTLLYSIEDPQVQEIKVSPGIMLLIYDKTPSHVPLKILCIETGKVVKAFKHLLHRGKKVEFIEQFNEKLLVKQEGENLQIVDVRNGWSQEVSRTQFVTPSAFIFLYENQLFLTFQKQTVAVWNFRGELVTNFEDHVLSPDGCNTNNIYITSEQDLIISYCRNGPPGFEVGSIHVSNILTGKCLARVSDEPKGSEPLQGFSRRNEALQDVTALFYNEERNEIYTGNREGFVHIWGN